MTTPALTCHKLRKVFGTTLAVDDVELQVAPGEILTMLGPSGCGKTTFLRLIAGFERPDAGLVTLAGRVVAGRDWVAPERRRVGFVFQDYALFPHMTVAQNVAYGLGRDEAARVAEVLALVGLHDRAARYPHELSGGEQQRVALARALAPRPNVVLLDEPFSSLDADLRLRVRSEVRQILRAADATAIFVTHDQEEAFEIADRLAVMRAGRIEQLGRPEEVYHVPATRFVADFVGEAAFLPAEVSDGELLLELGRFPLEGTSLPTGDVEVMVRPEDVQVFPDPDGTAAVVGRRFQGPVTVSVLHLPSGHEVSAAHSSQVPLSPQDRVRVSFRPDHLVLFRGDERVAWIRTRPVTGTDRAVLSDGGQGP